MPKIKIVHRYLNPPKETEIEVPQGSTVAQVLHKVNIRYDATIVAIKGKVIMDPVKVTVSDGDSIELLELADGG